jgi:hypothetical protein
MRRRQARPVPIFDPVPSEVVEAAKRAFRSRRGISGAQHMLERVRALGIGAFHVQPVAGAIGR